MLKKLAVRLALGSTAAGEIENTYISSKKRLMHSLSCKPRVNSDTTPKIEAASDLARDLQSVADDAGYDLQDVNPTSDEGAGATINKVHSSWWANETSLVTYVNNLNYKDTDPEAQRINKIIAKTALRSGKNKAKDKVSPADFKAIRELVGDTSEGRQLIPLCVNKTSLLECIVQV